MVFKFDESQPYYTTLQGPPLRVVITTWPEPMSRKGIW